ncbi:MAG: hypothetical protein V4543_03200 [Bacteroidota bacterium]
MLALLLTGLAQAQVIYQGNKNNLNLGPNSYCYKNGLHYLVWTDGRSSGSGGLYAAYDSYVKLSNSADGQSRSTENLFYTASGGFANPVLFIDDAGNKHIAYNEATDNADHVFTNQTNPFPYDSTRTYTAPYSDKSAQDFTAIRLGDVNESWNPSVHRLPVASALNFIIPNLSANPGRDIQIPFTAADFMNVAGFQLTFAWNADMARFIDLVPGAINPAFGTKWLLQGMLGLQWDNPDANGLSFSPETVLFSIRLHTNELLTENSLVSLHAGGMIVPSEAVSGNLELMQLPAANGSIRITGLTGTHTPVPADLNLSAAPNPFSQQTKISFIMPEAGPAGIKIYTALGAEVFEADISAAGAGEQTLLWNGTGKTGRALSAGTCFCVLNTLYQSRVVKLWVQ